MPRYSVDAHCWARVVVEAPDEPEASEKGIELISAAFDVVNHGDVSLSFDDGEPDVYLEEE